MWSPDGSRIFIAQDVKIAWVNSDGQKLGALSPPNEEDDSFADISPNISPDGAHIAFATLRHIRRRVLNYSRNLEIATVSIQGGEYRRLTDSPGHDSNPVWSPNGKHIAFVSLRAFENPEVDHSAGKGRPKGYGNVWVMAPDGSNQRVVTRPVGAMFAPPVWSPDSNQLAFLAVEDTEKEGHYRKVLYVVGANGAGLRRLSEATVHPAWAPDGSTIAFGREGDDAATILTIRPDGTDIQQVTEPGQFFRLYNLSWSPDGSEIRFMAGRTLQFEQGQQRVYGIHAIRPGGSGERLISDVGENQLAAWAPDDSRIAVFGQKHRDSRVQLYTIAPDGSDVRELVRRGIGGIVAENSDWLETDDDLRACSMSFVVREPGRNPGLVRDCEALIKSRNALAGEEITLLWNRNIPIADWAGVSVEGDPPRVSGLRFDGELNGRIPGALGDLEELKILALGRSDVSIGPIALRGQIPSELGNLTKLEGLFLDGNQLSGTIPPELGNLVNLRSLNLRYNKLSGRIPSELRNLTNLAYLRINGNQLTGCIPGALRELRPSNVSYDDWNRPC